MISKIISFLAECPSNPWFSYLWPIAVAIVAAVLNDKLYPSLHNTEHRHELLNSLPQLLFAVPDVASLGVDPSRRYFADLVVSVQSDEAPMTTTQYNFLKLDSSPHCGDSNIIAVRINNDSKKGISLVAFTDRKHGCISLDSFQNRCLERNHSIVIVFASKDVPSKIIFECDGKQFFYSTDLEKIHLGSYIAPKSNRT